MSIISIYDTIKDYTMCRPERFERFCQSILDTRDLSGVIIECGVWKGGMICGAAKFAINNNIQRTYYAFDSYEGFPEPTDKDIVALTNQSALSLENWGMKKCPAKSETLKDVYACMALLNIPEDTIIPVKGWFNDTVISFDKDISILRLDGDWYESTKVCLEYLYPKVVSGGIIILDDYGYWKGCKQATDEYLQYNNIHAVLHKTDYTEVWFIKP
jgi:hypothetical protein